MDIKQAQFSILNQDSLAPFAGTDPDLVLVFADIGLMRAPDFHQTLRHAFPRAILAGCSTAGEISAAGMSEGTLVLSALRFDKIAVRAAVVKIAAMEQSWQGGADLGRQLSDPQLRAVLVFGKGVDINGSALIAGLNHHLGDTVPISGGLAGDGGAFAATLTLCPDGVAADAIVALGLYGEHVAVSHGSFGGWQPFGPPRKVSRAEGNVLYALDDVPALDLYRDYLGEYAKDLPASGLLFPFEMLDAEQNSVGLIRTILGLDAQEGALILAGDIDPDGYLRLMHANNEGLIDGAEIAARRARDGMTGDGDGLALLVSCVGRKLVMGDAVDEEVEEVSHVLGRHVPLTGFYSYGEIAPFSSTTECKLHNQTMTVTFIVES